LGLSALNADTMFSLSEVSLSAELKPSSPEDSNDPPDYADRVVYYFHSVLTKHIKKSLIADG